MLLISLLSWLGGCNNFHCCLKCDSDGVISFIAYATHRTGYTGNKLGEYEGFTPKICGNWEKNLRSMI